MSQLIFMQLIKIVKVFEKNDFLEVWKYRGFLFVKKNNMLIFT